MLLLRIVPFYLVDIVWNLTNHHGIARHWFSFECGQMARAKFGVIPSMHVQENSPKPQNVNTNKSISRLYRQPNGACVLDKFQGFNIKHNFRLQCHCPLNSEIEKLGSTRIHTISQMSFLPWKSGDTHFECITWRQVTWRVTASTPTLWIYIGLQTLWPNWNLNAL